MLGTPRKQLKGTKALLPADDTVQFVSGNQLRHSAPAWDSYQFESARINSHLVGEARDHRCCLSAGVLPVQRDHGGNDTSAGTEEIVDSAQMITFEATTVRMAEAQQPILDAAQQTADTISEQAWPVCELDGSVTRSLSSGD